MKLFIACSKRNYPLVQDICIKLYDLGHELVFPNCMDNPHAEAQARKNGLHTEFKQTMYRQSDEQIQNVDALLVINPPDQFNSPYIGGATFLEMYDAWRHGKRIFINHAVTNKMLADEIAGFDCIVIGDDYEKINEYEAYAYDQFNCKCCGCSFTMDRALANSLRSIKEHQPQDELEFCVVCRQSGRAFGKTNNHTTTKEQLAELCDARDKLCNFCETDDCDWCKVTHLIDDAYNECPDENSDDE